ncbi:LLM class flavin-dependent oxidoreductase [Kitasatospora sp. NPDC017646]|uniref:LLM class flavin-dependent oxidoreductase n=1 Tax=Kitasatospora sp. NPDC017646 TaxID=3364024 RepID=UPI0037A0281C
MSGTRGRRLTNRADRYTRARRIRPAGTGVVGEESVRHRGPQFEVGGRLSLPRPPQGHPVVVQAGDSAEGREFAAATADVAFRRHSDFEAGRAFHADVKGRLAGHGREPDELKIMPSATLPSPVRPRTPRRPGPVRPGRRRWRPRHGGCAPRPSTAGCG